MALDALLDRRPPSRWRMLLDAPGPTLATLLQSKRSQMTSARFESSGEDAITVVCVSDTHGHEPKLPPGDLLIHAGDMTQSGTFAELQSQLDWLNAQPHAHKVVIAGNHDLILDDSKARELGWSPEDVRGLRWGSIKYLQDSSVRLRFRGGRTLLVDGTPWTRKHGNWAFQYERGTDMFSGHFADDADIFVTHSPPKHYLDLNGLGDGFLTQELWRVRPRLHVFGHIHAGYGKEQIIYDRFQTLSERVRGEGGFLAILSMILDFVMWYLGIWDTSRSGRSTCLINASNVGGVRDQFQQEAKVVRL